MNNLDPREKFPHLKIEAVVSYWIDLAICGLNSYKTSFSYTSCFFPNIIGVVGRGGGGAEGGGGIE